MGSFIILIIILSSFTLFAMGLISYFQKRLLNGYGFPLMMLASTVYSLGYAFELMSHSVDQAFFFLRIQYLGIPFLSTLWVITILQCTNSFKYLKLKYTGPMFIVSLATLFVMQTTQLTGLHYAALDQVFIDGLAITQITKGPWYYLFTVYQYSMLLLGIAIMAYKYRHAEKRLKEQYLLLTMGALFYAGGHIFYLSGLVPYNLDIGPILLCLTSATFIYGMNKGKLIHVVNLAQRQVFNNLPDAVVIISPDLYILDYNPLFVRLFSPMSDDLIGVSFKNLMGHVHEDIPECLACETEKQCSLRFDDLQGNRRHFMVTVTNLFRSHNHISAKVVAFRDITSEVDSLEKLNELAHFDQLTGILNRHAFYKALEEQIIACQTSNSGLAFIMMDIDHFKRFNDEHGHIAGDAVLKAFVEILRPLLSSKCLFSRFGGEEFIITLPCDNMSSAHAFASSLKDALNHHTIPWENKAFHITASFGVSFTPQVDRIQVDQNLRISDEALYLAKARGRNRVEIM